VLRPGVKSGRDSVRSIFACGGNFGSLVLGYRRSLGQGAGPLPA
jgi:hypothetical protein